MIDKSVWGQMRLMMKPRWANGSCGKPKVMRSSFFVLPIQDPRSVREPELRQMGVQHTGPWSPEVVVILSVKLYEAFGGTQFGPLPSTNVFVNIRIRICVCVRVCACVHVYINVYVFKCTQTCVAALTFHHTALGGSPFGHAVGHARINGWRGDGYRCGMAPFFSTFFQ